MWTISIVGWSNSLEAGVVSALYNIFAQSAVHMLHLSKLMWQHCCQNSGQAHTHGQTITVSCIQTMEVSCAART